MAYFRRPAEKESFLLMSASQIASRFAPQLHVTPTRLWMVCQRTQYEVEHTLPDADTPMSASDSPVPPSAEPELPF